MWDILRFVNIHITNHENNLSLGFRQRLDTLSVHELSELAAEFEARNIKLGDVCELGDWCELGAGCDIPKSLFISASRHAVSYWGEDVIQIGCKRYTISEWQKHFRKIGEAEGYSPEQMEEYKGYIDLIATMHKTWALH